MMSSPHDTTQTEASNRDDPTSNLLSMLWLTIVIHGIGVILAMTPLRWFIAGIIVAGLGTLMFTGLLRTEPFTQHPPGSPQRKRGHTLGRTAVIYGLLVILLGLGSAALSSEVFVPGITLAVMTCVPIGIGFRHIAAAADKHPFQALLARPRLLATVCGGTLVLLFALVTFSGVNAGSRNGSMLWVFLIPTFLIAALAVSGLKAPNSIKILFVLSYLFLIVANGIGGHSGWLTLAGNPPQNCEVRGTDYHYSSRSPSYTSYRVQCGSERLGYTPLDFKDAPGKDRLTLVTDSTGLSNPLHTTEVPGVRGYVYFAAYGVSGFLLVLTLIPWRQRRTTI